MKKILSLLSVWLCVLTLATPSLAKQFDVDSAHSSIAFSVTHLGLSEVEGRFNDFQGTIHWDKAKISASKIDWTVKVESVDTGNAKRDEHLRSEDFFNQAKFTTMSFKSTSVSKLSGDKYKVDGDLTMRGVTKRVTMSATIKGPLEVMGGESIGFSTSFKVNRIEYGVGAGWKGGSDKVVGHDVFVRIKGEAHETE